MPTSTSRRSGPSRSKWNRAEIVALLLECGRIAQSARRRLRTELKSDSSLVTQADKAIERRFARRFDRPREGLYLIGEETVAQKGNGYIRDALGGVTHVVDPIDGTSPFAHLLPTWGISIGRMQRSRLTDGAVYLPDMRLLVVSDGPRVVCGSRAEGSSRWSWRVLKRPALSRGPSGLVAITQEIAKRGRVRLPNPVQALGAAVVPLVGLLLGRFHAYAGSLRLWDVAGCLPLLARLGFALERLDAPRGTRLGLEVDDRGYWLDPSSSYAWGVRGGVLICAPSVAGSIRAGIDLESDRRLRPHHRSGSGRSNE